MAKLSDYIKYSPKQQQVADLVGSGKIILIGGKKYGGKSYGLGNMAMETAMRYPGIKVTISRSVREQLTENFWNSMLTRFPKNVFGYKTNAQDRAWYFHNKSLIKFTAFQYEKDMKKGRGVGSDVFLVDEIQDYTPKQIRAMIIHTRDTGGYTGEKPFHPTFIGSFNPGGVSHYWIKYHAVKPDYSKWEIDELKLKDKYQFIQFGMDDNTMLTNAQREEYDLQLSVLPEAELRAMRDGDMDSFDGQFFEEWNPLKHIVKPFEIPSHWIRKIGFDKGGGSEKHPSVMLFGAQDPDTLKVYIYKELVVVGSLPFLVTKIKDNTDSERITEWLADPQIFKDYTDDGHILSEYFHNRSIPFEPANNKREEGWTIVKAWLYHSEEQEPMLQVFDNCHYLIETLPIMEYSKSIRANKEDLNTRGLDDACLVGETLVMTDKGEIPIKNIKIGDKVLTRKGFKKVLASGCTGVKEVEDFRIGNNFIQCTDTHKIITDTDKIEIFLFPEQTGWYYFLKDGKVCKGNIGMTKFNRSMRKGRALVYNITVEDEHEFYANGILVSNCDALRYLLTSGYSYPTPQMIEYSNRVVQPQITVPNLRPTYNLSYNSVYKPRLSRAHY
jgi:hypothetical protein